MKTTTKLSVFAFLGLSFVAYYGQDYSGKVGINTDKPNATLEIKGKSDNTNNTLEGLVIPNVSINKTLQMGGNTSIKESTLIYVNDLSDYTTTPADAKVIDITEKGYYFWNGTKWVKTAGKEGQEWVYNPTNKRIELKRSGTPPFNNKVYYDENGVAYNGGHSEDDDVIFAITATDPVKGVITKYIPTPYKGTARGKVSMYDTLDNLPLNTFKHPITGASIYLKNQRSNFLSISSSDQYQPGVGVVGGRNQIDILEGNNNSYSSVLGSTFLANAIGGGTVSILDGIQSYGNVGNGQSAGTLRGGFLQASFDTSGNVDNLYGSQGTAFLKPAATGNVTNAVGGYFFSNIGSKGLNTNVYGTIGQVSVGKDSGNTTFVGERLVAGCFTVYNSGRTQYKTQSGVYAGSTVADPTVATAPINNYGVFVENISGGSNGNYAMLIRR
uniref:hypothetical protein n=1 Tax=Riemerella anatipestifer TaxID=34085 RepID=UPI0030EB7F99